MKLAALGHPIFGQQKDYPFINLARSLLLSHQEKLRLLADYLCPADQRIQEFLNDYFADLALDEPVRLPGRTLILDRHGLARMLSLPPDQDRFESDIITSYRTANGVLHNPKHDRRTTQGAFHVADGGLPIADDKKAVPKIAFAHILQAALQPPMVLQRLPFTASQNDQAALFVSLLLRPTVCPAVDGFITKKSMEIRFFAPGNLVCNLDFVESIFGNAGDPYLVENDAGLDVDHWTGHTGCVILAPQVLALTKKAIGLPHISEASERQKRDGMCWEDEEECYNDGEPFKITARDQRGVIVTVIADNYFGYCKKEVKTQIGYAANLYGLCEEEHAGGALVYASYDLGEDFQLSRYYREVDHTFTEMLEHYGALMELKPEGYAVDKRYPEIIYLCESVHFDLNHSQITWDEGEAKQSLALLPDHCYVLPSGYQVTMAKPTEGQRWRLVGTTAKGVLCHKPSTVSGGGKSEISKPLSDAILAGPFYINDVNKDFDTVEGIVTKEYGQRFRDPRRSHDRGRPFLSPERSLGSVIKLLIASPDYTDEYNNWVDSLPQHIKDMALVLKRYYKPDWGEDWRSRFSVDLIHGWPGKELRYRKRKIVASYVRVGFTTEGSWRTFVLRKDFLPAVKLSCEDDITASVVVPARALNGLHTGQKNPAIKFVQNVEYRLFQRPDDAIIRGYDKKTEADQSRLGNFFSNYQPLTRSEVAALERDVFRFEQYTAPMQQCLRDFVQSPRSDYLVCSSHPRLVNGVPSKNPRYLQNRPDLEDPRARYLAEVRTRFYRRIPLDQPVPLPVNAVLAGRRNNPPEDGIRPLCVFNPIHYLELPELFMEFIASLTGKSPSTTGAGSEGALTKGPFNALRPIHDLNSALVSFLLTGYPAFITAAGHLGPNCPVAHDISLLVPEIWCRMQTHEQEPSWLIEKGCLEPCEDFTHQGKPILASRLGWRITRRFVNTFCGRIFNNPAVVFTDEMLKPELQDREVFADGVDNIVSAHRWVAEQYFSDGSIEVACPPLQALLHIMAYGHYEGKGIEDKTLRALFTREALLDSDWYAQRLKARQRVERDLCQRQILYLEAFLAKATYGKEARRLGIVERLERLQVQRQKLMSPDYVESLRGTLGTEPFAKGA